MLLSLPPVTSPWPSIGIISRNPPRVGIAKAAIAGEHIGAASLYRGIAAIFICRAIAIIEDCTPRTFISLPRARLEQHRNEGNARNQ
jgi:hypothetical protein